MILINMLVLLAAAFQLELAKAAESCPLDSRTIYSYVVKIWNREASTTFGHGAILSVFSVITGCTNFREWFPNKHINDFQIIGVKVQQVQPTQKACSQTRDVVYYAPHPNCTEPNEQLFNAALFILKDPFDATGSFSYPTIPIMNDPFHLTQDIMYLDQVKDSQCELVLFYHFDRTDPTFNTQWQVTSIPFKTECIPLFCEYEPRNEEKTQACYARYGNRVNGTQLCMKPKGPIIPGMVNYKKTDVNWFSGGPLVCNGTSVGMTTQVKWRTDFSGQHTKREDFFYVMTFARIYEWVFENKVRYGANWIHPFFIENESLKKGEVVAPSRKPRPEPTLFPGYRNHLLQFLAGNP